MSDQRPPFDYHLGQRYHGMDSPVFQDALTRVPLDDQWLDDCCKCGHQIFVQRAAGERSEVVPLICTQCAIVELYGEQPALSNYLNLEACPPGCYYVRRAS